MNSTLDPLIRIGIAEDDEDLLEILSGALQPGRREIRRFKEGRAVIEALERLSFDILITDLMMPGAGGLQILEETRKRCPECIVIIITGYASLDTAIQAIRGGAYDYIRKPFKLDELEIVVNNACEKIFLRRENSRLVERLKETLQEVRRLREALDAHMSPPSNLSRMTSGAKDPDLEFILNQIHPNPPDRDLRKDEVQKKAIDLLERLIQFRAKGYIDGDEFLSLKKILFKGLYDSSRSLPQKS